MQTCLSPKWTQLLKFRLAEIAVVMPGAVTDPKWNVRSPNRFIAFAIYWRYSVRYCLVVRTVQVRFIQLVLLQYHCIRFKPKLNQLFSFLLAVEFPLRFRIPRYCTHNFVCKIVSTTSRSGRYDTRL